MEILGLLDKLEYALTNSSRVPATHKVILDLDRMLELVDQMRLTIPQDIQDAQDIVSSKETFINQALLDARRIKAQSEEDSRQRVGESTIVQEAERQAEAILEDSKKRSDALLQDSQRKYHQLSQDAQTFGELRSTEADRYAQEVLVRLEEHLASVLRSVRTGLDSLEEEQKSKVA